MGETAIQKPFSTPFLKDLVVVAGLLPFKDQEIQELDQELAQYEQFFLNPDVEKFLISRNELLTSFAISKAEVSTLTLQEAQEVYDFVVSNKEYDFVGQKLKSGKKLTQKDHDKLEFFNIATAFRSLNAQQFKIEDLTPDYILSLHKQLTQGLDIFKDHLPEFEVYKAGCWRDNDLIRVGTYIPAPFKLIEKGVVELIRYVKKNPTITAIAIFHTALYALHPFNNGNKRVCRILEHLLLRSIGLNQKNLYSTSYYYHKGKPRYYKYLLYSLERKNLNHFVAFIQEALVLSIISVVQTSLQAKRNDFLQRQKEEIRTIFKPLIKRRQLQFKHLYNNVKRKMARQTFVNYLDQAGKLHLVNKREEGRAMYYSLNLEEPEQKTLTHWIEFAKSRLSYIPDEVLLV